MCFQLFEPIITMKNKVISSNQHATIPEPRDTGRNRDQTFDILFTAAANFKLRSLLDQTCQQTDVSNSDPVLLPNFQP